MSSSNFPSTQIPPREFVVRRGWTYTCHGCGFSAPIRFTRQPSVRLCAGKGSQPCKVINYTTPVFVYRHWSVR